jgi:hypothetical protein
VIITLLNHQLTLGEAFTYLTKKIRMLLKDLDEEESKSYGLILQTLNTQAFSSLTG